jgi:hypothetical protein
MQTNNTWSVSPGPQGRGLVLVRDNKTHIRCECSCGGQIAAIERERCNIETLVCVACGELPQRCWIVPHNASELWAALAATMVPLPPDTLWDR